MSNEFNCLAAQKYILWGLKNKPDQSFCNYDLEERSKKFGKKGLKVPACVNCKLCSSALRHLSKMI